MIVPYVLMSLRYNICGYYVKRIAQGWEGATVGRLRGSITDCWTAFDLLYTKYTKYTNTITIIPSSLPLLHHLFIYSFIFIFKLPIPFSSSLLFHLSLTFSPYRVHSFAFSLPSLPSLPSHFAFGALTSQEPPSSIVHRPSNVDRSHRPRQCVFDSNLTRLP